MAKIYGTESQYLIKQDRKYRIIALYFISLLVISLGLFYIIPKSTLNIILVSFTLFIGLAIYLNKKGHLFLDRSDNYYKGRKGEYAIFYELKRLPNDYLVFQDIKIPGNESNIDFIAIGPTGIFAIEVKSHKGKITFDGQNLLINNNHFKKDILRQAMSGALDLHEFILKKTGKDCFVYPVLVFSNNQAYMKFGLNSIKKVFVIQKTYLKKVVLGAKPILSTEDITNLKNILLFLSQKD